MEKLNRKRKYYELKNEQTFTMISRKIQSTSDEMCPFSYKLHEKKHEL